MTGLVLPESLSQSKIYMVGIKGTGMAALAEILVAAGATVTGSDTTEHFSTDDILQELQISYAEGFAASNLPGEVDLVIHSTAYDPASHDELVEAARRGLHILTYPEALGLMSGTMPAIGIAGVHGKTTTAAMCASIVRECALPGTVLAGSSLSGTGGRATLVAGSSFFVAETCEYRRAFLNFCPSIVVVTSVEADHLDYYEDAADIMSAFREYAERLPAGGELIFCADDAGALELSGEVAVARPDIVMTPYGEGIGGEPVDGEGKVTFLESGSGRTRFTVGDAEYVLRVPGRHNALNAAAAIIATRRAAGFAGTDVVPGCARKGLESFAGTRRRSEIVGEAGGVLVMDDYGHHPTAIAATLAGYREFFPGRRIVLDFMSHTYTRTAALLEEFARALTGADVLILHRIYASARERYSGEVTGQTLAEAVRDAASGEAVGPLNASDVHYFHEVRDALKPAIDLVRPGDIFVTMGAGNNWELGRALLDRLKGEVSS